jgi:hypothetical protein
MMANATAPRGLQPVRGVNSQSVTGGPRSYVHDSGDGTALYVGDPVKLTGAASTVNGVTMPNVIRAATGDVIVGVVIGVQPETSASLGYVAASTTRVVFVDDDPNSLFEVQDIATGTLLTEAAIGLNVDFTGSGGSTSTGFSALTLNNATEATTNTLDLKIIDVVNRVDNTVGDTGPLRFLVKINRHQHANQVAGV